MHRVMMAFVFACGLSSPAWSAVIEVPAPNQIMSGISYFSGWKCVQGSLTARIDGGEPFALGSFHSRGDTREVCGDVDNGWVIQFNFNRLSQGMHTFEAFDDGTSFATVEFEVVHFDEEFKTDATGECTGTLSDGSRVELTWAQNLQNFGITEICAGFPSGGYRIDTTFTSKDESCPEEASQDLVSRLLLMEQTGTVLSATETDSERTYTGNMSCEGTWHMGLNGSITRPLGHGCIRFVHFEFSGDIGNGVPDSEAEAIIIIRDAGADCAMSRQRHCRMFYEGTLTPADSSTLVHTAEHEE